MGSCECGNESLGFTKKKKLWIPPLIFGPTRTDDGYWRIKTNHEINYILKGQNIIGFIKKTKIKLAKPCRTHG